MSDLSWMMLAVALLAGVAANAVLLVRVNRKVANVHHAVRRLRLYVEGESVQLFQQVQHAERLRALLRLDTPLPIMRGWSASPDFLYVIARHALAAKPGLAVECGSGTSTLVLARCLALNGSGRLFSLESDAGFADATRAMLREAKLEGIATVIHAPLQPTGTGNAQPWYATRDLPDGPIDMLVVDGPPEDTAPQARYPAGPALATRVRPGASIFLDDARRPDERAIVRRWLQELPGLSQGPAHHCEKGCVELVVARR